MTNRLARNLRRNPTDAEKRLWSKLRRDSLDGWHFRRQAPIGRYIVDFVCHSAKLVVEVDGGQHADRAFGDAARTRWLESQGYRILRFWNNDVLQRTESVVEIIRLALREVPPPQPCPTRGEGV